MTLRRPAQVRRSASATLMAWFWPSSLQQRLLLVFSTVLLLLLLLVSGGILLFLYRAEQRAWQGRQADSAENGAAIVANFVRRAEDLLSIAALGYADNANLPNLLLAQEDTLLEMVLVDANGAILEAVWRDAPTLADSFTVPQANWFLRARDGERYFSPLLVGTEDTLTLLVAQPMPQGGVVAGRLRMDVLREVVASTRLGAGGATQLVNASGQVLADADPRVVAAGTTLAGRPEHRTVLAATGPANMGAYPNVKGVWVVGAAAPVPLTVDWWVLAEVPVWEAFATTQQALLLIGGLALMIWLGFVLFAARFLSRAVFRPLRLLQRGAQTVEAGNLGARVPVLHHDEIGQVARAFNAMVARLQARSTEREQLVKDLQATTAQALESVRLKSEFLSTMSHELRTPLNAISGYAGIMTQGMGGTLDDEATYLVRRIEVNSAHLLRLINDILDLAKVEAGRMDLHETTIDVAPLVETWQAQTAVLAEAKGLAFATHIDPALPPALLGDAARLTQIALNLLSNAVKFTEAGRVDLHLLPVGTTQWALRVTDTGVGIPSDAQGYIFDEFRQVDGSSRRTHGGTGLGLAIVKNLAQLMGGTITVASVVGQGATFTVTLPLRTPFDDGDTQAHRPVPADKLHQPA